MPVLVHKLCDEPETMRVIRRALPFLQGKKLCQKVKFVKQTALYNGSAGSMFVMDSEGNRQSRLAELMKGRDSAYLGFPMAVGVAHPCIEAWLLADPEALARGLKLPSPPAAPQNPESLPAPQKDRTHNPKTVLAERGRQPSFVPACHTNCVRDCRSCPGVGALPSRIPPFAQEVEERIAPLYR